MNTNENAKKRFDYRHIICISFTLGCLACSVFLYSGALGRLIEGGRDFGLSVGYYFCEIFGIRHNITPTVNDLPKIPFFDFTQAPSPSTPLPDTPQGTSKTIIESTLSTNKISRRKTSILPYSEMPRPLRFSNPCKG